MTATHTPGQTTETPHRASQDFTQQVQQVNLDEECLGLIQEAAGNPSRRAAKTVSKNSSITVTLLALSAGTEIKDHKAHGPAVLQTIRGEVTVLLKDSRLDLPLGRVVTLAGQVPHYLSASVDSVVMLVVASDH